MFGLSFGEVILLVLLVLVVVGPRELPSMMRSLGRTLSRMRRMTTQLREQSGIDEILRAEGIDRELQELRKLAQGRLLDVNLDDVLEENVPPPPRWREYPPGGVDVFGALPEEAHPYFPTPEIVAATPAALPAPTIVAASPAALPAPTIVAATAALTTPEAAALAAPEAAAPEAAALASPEAAAPTTAALAAPEAAAPEAVTPAAPEAAALAAPEATTPAGAAPALDAIAAAPEAPAAPGEATSAQEIVQPVEATPAPLAADPPRDLASPFEHVATHGAPATSEVAPASDASEAPTGQTSSGLLSKQADASPAAAPSALQVHDALGELAPTSASVPAAPDTFAPVEVPAPDALGAFATESAPTPEAPRAPAQDAEAPRAPAQDTEAPRTLSQEAGTPRAAGPSERPATAAAPEAEGAVGAAWLPGSLPAPALLELPRGAGSASRTLPGLGISAKSFGVPIPSTPEPDAEGRVARGAARPAPADVVAVPDEPATPASGEGRGG